jgi:hypothetical protein
MKVIIDQLLSFIKLYSWKHWLAIFLFCTISVSLNYTYGIEKLINRQSDSVGFLLFFLLYASHSLFAFLMYSISSKDFSFWTKPGFVLLLLAGLLIFSTRATLWQHGLLIEYFSDDTQYRINRFTFNNIFRLLYIIIPVTLVWYFVDRKEMPLYGVSLKNHKPKVYWILLLCMVPLIIGASFLSDFLEYYPRYHKLQNLGASNLKILAYEICYGLDFTSIELFFRGFLIIAFIKYVGIHSVLPMACFYLSIHFGKPIGEAISSFFGGSILGVIAFQSRSIFGGLMVHVGIAWLMEIGAGIGNYLKDNL